LIAISLLTAGIAVAVGSTTTLASEAEPTAVAREETEQGPRNLTLEGQVTNASSGEPVAGLELRIHNVWETRDGDEQYRSRDSLSAATDDEGRYSVNVSEGHVDLRIDDESYQRAYAEFSVRNDTRLDIPMEPVSQDLARVHGTVTSEDGDPIEDAYVQISPVPEGCEDAWDCEQHPKDARAAGDRSSSREVETDEGTVEITYHPRSDRHVRAETGPQGDYEVRVPDGHYRIFVRADGHLNARTSVEAPEGASARADASLTPFPPRSVSVEGAIVDQDTDEPIEAAEIRVENLKWGTDNRTRTDEDGRFQLSIEPGYALVQIRADETYHVPCQPADEGTEEDDGNGANRTEVCDNRRERSTAYLPIETTIQTEAGQTVAFDRGLQPEPQPDARLDGWVVNASTGEAVPDAQLQIRNEETGEWGQAATGEDGSFQVDVDEGYYTVRVRADGYYGNATNVQVDGDERITVQLTPGQPADDRYHHGRVAYDGVEETEAGDGGMEDAASEPTGSSSGGEEAYQGGPAELGPPSGKKMGVDPVKNAPGPGVLAGLAVVGVGAALARREAR
jgi:hypothetical protein